MIREGRVESLFQAHPTLSSAAVGWTGLRVEDYTIPAGAIPCHEHGENFLHMVVQGSAKYEVRTRGKTLRFKASPGTTSIEPQGTIDEVRWGGPMHCIAVAIQPSLLSNALEETAPEREVELTEHWNVTDRHIASVLLAMTTDLEEGSPVGRLYGESLANALAVYLLNRYAVQRQTAAVYKGGLPGYRLKRVLDYIEENLAEESLSLSQLAAVAGIVRTILPSCSGKAPVMRHIVMCCCSGSNVPNKASASRRVASSRRDSTQAFRILAISPACFANSWASVRQDSNPR